MFGLGLLVLAIAIVGVFLGLHQLESGSYSGLLDSKEAALAKCQPHVGSLGQAAGSDCGTMVGNVCRRGKVNSARTTCDVQGRGLGHGLVIGSAVLGVVGIVMMFLPGGKYAHRGHSHKSGNRK